MDTGEIILFQTQGGETKIEVRLAHESVWLTADQMAELFQRNKSTISRHIKNILESVELKRDSVVAEIATTASDGKTYNVAYYNLDMILSVGYRVNSHRGVHFIESFEAAPKEAPIHPQIGGGSPRPSLQSPST